MMFLQQLLITTSLTPRVRRDSLLPDRPINRLRRVKKNRKGNSIDIINRLRRRLNPALLTESAKNLVPKSRLLTIVVTLLPSSAVVQVVVLDDEFAVEVFQEPREWVGGNEVDTETGVADKFAEDDVLRADPPGVEVHWETNGLESGPRAERDDSDVKKFLWLIGVQSEKWVRVFGEMMCAVEFPEVIIIVHDSVIPVEVEVKHDAVKTDRDRKPLPAQVDGRL